MTSTRPALSATRRARGWSQTDAACELAALARAGGGPGATTASLKSLLSRWENGHATPEPQYRALLADLYGRSPAELGLASPAATAAPGAADRLRARLAMAAAVDAGVLRTWADQLEVARRLDDEVGAAGSAGLVRALVDELDRTLTHTVESPARGAVAALLAQACVLAGWQELDRGDPEQAWLRFAHARIHGAQAGPDRAPEATAAQATAGQVAVLIDLGDPAAALTLLDQTAPPPGGPIPNVIAAPAPAPDTTAPTAPTRAWIAAARGAALAAAGRLGQAQQSFDTAELALSSRADTGEGPAGAALEMAVDLAAMRCWRGQALATLDEPGATAALERLLLDGVRSVRNRAVAHAILATTADGRSPAAGQHARTARALAERIGSARTFALLNPRRPAP